MRTARAVPTPWLCRKTMISRTIFRPSAGNTLGPHRPDPSHLAKTVGLGLDHIEHFVAERLDHLLGVDRANATDHPGTEILFDPFGRGWRRRAHEPRFELLAVGPLI